MKPSSKKIVAILLTVLTVISQSSALALYYGPGKVRALLAQENLASVLLPQFRHDQFHVELKQKTNLDLVVENDAKVVQVEVIGAEAPGLGIDSDNLIKKGIKIFSPKAARQEQINSKTTKTLVATSKASYNLTKKQNQFLIIEGTDFKVLRIPVTGILPGTYTLKATIDNNKTSTTQVITKPSFRIDSVTPSILVKGVQSVLSIIGKGLDTFTNVSFSSPDIQIIGEPQSIDDDTLLRVTVIPKLSTSIGAYDTSITSPFTGDSVTLVNGLYVSDPTALGTDSVIVPVAGMDGMDGVNGVSICNDSTSTLMVFANNLPAGSQPTVFLDPIQCNLTFNIPTGFNGVNASGADGMGLCNNPFSTPTTVVNTVSYTTAANVTLDPVACTLTYDIPQGKPGSLISSATEAAGANCTYGGIKVQSGVDTNVNSTLDAGEVTTTAYVCNGTDSLTSSTTEAAGANCADGGIKVTSGKDTNNNNMLDAGEVSSTNYVCNGSDGLTATTTEAAGANCATGGIKVTSGKDTNNNNMLDAGEVALTNYVCNGAVGATGATGANGHNTLVNVTTEAAGANCATGGKKIESGVDANDNGTLAGGEIMSTNYVCNGAVGATGATGANGHNSLVNVTTEAAGANCATGGKKVESGVDANDNGTLAGGEIMSTNYVCNGAVGATGATGANGHNSLVNVTTEAAGANCATGGKKVESGVDANDNGTLAGGEITSTNYVCNGAVGATGATGANGMDGTNGASGTNGHNSLVNVTTETAGPNCVNGGQKIETGVDANDNSTLDAGEVNALETSYVCNGQNGTSGTGHNSLVNVTTEAAGANCADGGQKIESGLDTNDDTTLQLGEVTSTKYVCDGVDGSNGATGATGANGHNSLVNVITEAEGANCSNGGKKVESGIDTDESGTLAGGEITSTNYVCNGEDALPTIQEIITNWDTYSSEVDYTTTGGAMARMVKIPQFTEVLNDGIVYGGFWIDKYEASKSDATAAAAGSSSNYGSKRNVVPVASISHAAAKAAGNAAGRQITGLGSCHLANMKEWQALYLLGRYAKTSGKFSADTTTGWDENGNSRNGRDGRNSGSFICADDPTLAGTNRCLTGTGYKSWGHLLDATALTNPKAGTGAGLGVLSADANAVKDTGSGTGADRFDGDLQVYDLVGNVKEWIDYTITRTTGAVYTIDAGYQGEGGTLPYTTNGDSFDLGDISLDPSLRGLGLPVDNSTAGANTGVIITNSTNQTIGVARGGSYSDSASANSPLTIDLTNSTSATLSTAGFRVTCDLAP